MAAEWARQRAARDKGSRPAPTAGVPLFAEGAPSVDKVRGRGIVTCTYPALMKATAATLVRIAQSGSKLPVQIWHVGEIRTGNLEVLRKLQWVKVNNFRYNATAHQERLSSKEKRRAWRRRMATLPAEKRLPFAARLLEGASTVMSKRSFPGRHLSLSLGSER